MENNHPPLHSAANRARIEMDEATRQQLLQLRRKIKNIITQAQPALVELEQILDIPPDKRWQAN